MKAYLGLCLNGLALVLACADARGGGAAPKIYLISADNRVVPVTSDPNEEHGAPTVSPDEHWIYFESHRTAYDDESPTQIGRIPNPLPQVDTSVPLCLVP